ncbi:MAG TPA: hypothetical protein V6C81_08250 [Planktothrix sp.]
MHQRKTYGHLSLLHADPVILYAIDWELFDPTAGLWTILEELPVRRSHLVLAMSSTLEDWQFVLRVGAEMQRFTNRFKHVVVTIKANNAAELANVKTRGLRALLCSQNALVKEDLFYPIPDSSKFFDAIYDAKWADFKRHQLAANIQNLALLAFPLEQACSQNYSQDVRPMLEHATWLTSPWMDNPPYLSCAQVNEAYNKSRVGLCLSRVEGAMFSSVQYLLAGLPVVTTRNTGGRDEFFDQETVRWVDDDPCAVSQAVAELASLSLPPSSIRQKALEKIAVHRQRMLEFMQKTISDEDGQIGRWHSWPQDLPNKLMEPVAEIRDVLRAIKEHSQGKSLR